MIDTELARALNEPDDGERRYAAREISDLDDPEAVALLIGQLQREGSRAVKEAILRGLSRMGSMCPVDTVVDLLRDTDPFVRAEAADILQRRAVEAFASLSDLTRSEDKDLRKFSIDILSQAPSDGLDSLYLRALEDEDINVAISAIESIGSGRRTALADRVAEMAVATSNPMALCACLDTLALIGTCESFDVLRKRFPALTQVSGLYLPAYVKAMGGAAGPEAIPELCSLMQHKGPPIHEVAIDAMLRIVARHEVVQLEEGCEVYLCNQLVESYAPDTRFRLVRLLGHFTASERVASHLSPLLDSSDPQLALAVAEALRNSSAPSVKQAVAALVAKTEEAETGEMPARRTGWN